MKRAAWIIPITLMALAACSGRGGAPTGGVLPQGGDTNTSPRTIASSSSTQVVGAGEIFGTDNLFTPNDGNTSSGGQGQTVDGMPCASTMPGTYHVHAFVGILINGMHPALPDGTGMKAPHSDGTFAGFPNWTEYASCYYYMHTHDASGVVHIESKASASAETSLYNLGNYFDVWGQPLSTTQIAQYKGTVRAYVAQVPYETIYIQPSSYVLFTGNPRSIPLKSHTTVWLEIGPTYVAPSAFPVIHYYMAR